MNMRLSICMLLSSSTLCVGFRLTGSSLVSFHGRVLRVYIKNILGFSYKLDFKLDLTLLNC